MHTLLIQDLSHRFSLKQGIQFELLTVTLGACLLAALSKISFLLPGNPVPVTFQTLGVLLLGASLGPKRGLSSVLVYLAAGFMGVPVFASGLLLGPSLGYLIGFLPATYLVGTFAQGGMGFLRSLPIYLLGLSVIFAMGTLWLSYFVGFEQAFTLGVLPFLPGEAIKLGFLSTLLPGARKLLGS